MAETKVSFIPTQAVLAGPPELLTPDKEQCLFREMRQRKAFEQSRRYGVVDDCHWEEGLSFDAQGDTGEWDELPKNQSWYAASYKLCQRGNTVVI